MRTEKLRNKHLTTHYDNDNIMELNDFTTFADDVVLGWCPMKPMADVGGGRIWMAILTTNLNWPDMPDDDDEPTKGIVIYTPDFGEVDCHMTLDNIHQNLAYITTQQHGEDKGEMRKNIFQLNQLFGFDGKSKDLPAYIKGLLT